MAKQAYSGPLEQVGPCQWKIPKSYKAGMRVDGVIYADERLIEQIRRDQAPEQVANVATLPGIQQHSLAMPDIHWGYGFAIGGVAATDPREGGVVSPGGVGYDINCGVRVVRSNLVHADVRDHVRRLVDELFRCIPTGVGRTGKYRFRPDQMRHLLAEGPRYLVRTRGLGSARDIEFTEAGGQLEGADPDEVSPRAFARGEEQCGTLGQPFPGSTGGRSGARSRGRRRHGALRGADCRAHSLRFARARVPGVRRFPREAAQRARAVRHRAAGPAIGLRAGGQSPAGSTSRPCARRPISPGAIVSS